MRLFLYCCLLMVLPLAAQELIPVDFMNHYTVPGQATILEFSASGENLPDTFEYLLYDYNGKECGKGVLKHFASGKKYQTNQVFPQGFFELFIVASDQRFGIVSLPEFSDNRDYFWGMNIKQSPHDEDIRLFELLHRFGVQSFRKWHPYWVEEKEPGVWGLPCLELCYQYAAKQKMAPLFYFNRVPLYMRAEKDRKNHALKVYPGTLLPMEKSLSAMLSRRMNSLGSYQVWNEPDLKKCPSDSYISFLAANSWYVMQNHPSVPVVSSGFSTADVSAEVFAPYLKNGLLDLVDVFAFHNYSNPETFLQHLKKFRQLLEAYPKGNLPFWITECGKSWYRGIINPSQVYGGPIGKLRADIDDDLLSLNWIVSKACLARAAGVERFFPFILNFHSEGRGNFGLLDFHSTPLRSLAGYFFCVRILSGKEYIGSTTVAPEGERRMLFFSDDEENIVVILTGNHEIEKIDISTLNASVLYAADGSRMNANKSNTYYVSGGIAYAAVKEFPAPDKPDPLLKLSHIARNYRKTVKKAYPVVFSFDSSEIKHRNKEAYLITPSKLKFKISNLSDEKQILALQLLLPAGGNCKTKVPPMLELPPRSEKHISLDVNLSAITNHEFEIILTDKHNSARKLILFFSDPYRLRTESFGLNSPNSWRPHCAGKNMTVSMDKKENAIHFHVDFSNVKDESHWVNPEYSLNLPNESLRNSVGISFDIKTRQSNGSFRFQYASFQVVFEHAGDYITFSYPKPSLPEWEHRIFLWPNTLDTGKIRGIRIGLGPTSDILDYWLRNIKIHYKD